MRQETISLYKKGDILTHGNERIIVEKCVVKGFGNTIQLGVYSTNGHFHILESSYLEKI